LIGATKVTKPRGNVHSIAITIPGQFLDVPGCDPDSNGKSDATLCRRRLFGVDSLYFNNEFDRFAAVGKNNHYPIA
jgi:hypothetical protein